MFIVRLPKDRQKKRDSSCKWFFTDQYEHHWKQFIWLITIWSTNIYFLHMFTRFGWGLTIPTPTPIDTEFRRLYELGIFGIKNFKFKNLSLLSLKQWRVQEFQNQGRGPGAVEFLGSGDCFDALSHICS